MLPILLKNIPNILTLIRLVLIAPFLIFLYHHVYANAFYLYLFAGFTDCLDGWLARHFQWQSRFGSFLDPIADKLLVALSFISLALMNQLPWWLVVLVFMRDATISVGVILWCWQINSNIDFKPTLLSKINTAMQLAIVSFCLFELAFLDATFSYGYIVNILIALTALTTTITYVDYVWTWGRKASLLANSLTK